MKVNCNRKIPAKTVWNNVVLTGYSTQYNINLHVIQLQASVTVRGFTVNMGAS